MMRAFHSQSTSSDEAIDSRYRIKTTSKHKLCNGRRVFAEATISESLYQQSECWCEWRTLWCEIVNKGVADKIRRTSALTKKAFWRSLNAYIH